MSQINLYFVIIFLMCLSQYFTRDIYSMFHQNDYKIDFQRIELIDYNKFVFNLVEVKTFKYNRSLPVVNATFNSKVNMSTELEVTVQLYKFLSNEYRKLSGSSFQLNFCRTLHTNLAGMRTILSRCGNMSTTCKIVEGKTYELCNAYPDESLFPSFIPNGEYKFQVNVIRIGEIIVTIEIYSKIYRPVKPAKH